MSGTIITIIAIAVGIAVCIAGVYYLIHEKNDSDSRKIYGWMTAIGAIIAIAAIVKIAVWGI